MFLAAGGLAAKLVLMTPNGVTVTDYPSMQRCEEARTALLKKVMSEAQRNVPQGYHLVAPPSVTAVCIPA